MTQTWIHGMNGKVIQSNRNPSSFQLQSFLPLQMENIIFVYMDICQYIWEQTFEKLRSGTWKKKTLIRNCSQWQTRKCIFYISVQNMD